MERIRQKTSGTYSLSVEPRDEDGVLYVPAGTLSVAISDGSGVAVDSGTPIYASGELTYELSVADAPYLDTYTAVWTDADTTVRQWTTQIEIVGGHLFEIAELRAFDVALASTAKYTASLVRAARTAAEQRLEQAAHVAFVPRARRYSTVGDGSYRLLVPDTALRGVPREASIDGTALTAEELDALIVREWGAFDREDALWTQGDAVEVWYEHGLDAPPEPVRSAAMVLAREYLVASSLSSRAVTEATEIGFFRLSIAGRDGATGIPEVDEVIREFGRSGLRVW